jgi:AIPR protein
VTASLGGMVALVKLEDYFSFIRSPEGQLRESIFEENVRGYEGNTNINKGISSSLRATDDPVDFWWLNNGVTIIGTRVSYAHKTAAIEDPQVVNGLQTSRALFNHFDGNGSSEADGRLILVRVIQAADDKVAAQIIKATNSQNRVPSASLRAAEPFQRSIEEYLLARGRYYERRRNFYKNQGVRRSAIVSVLELAQAVASIVLALPHEARGRPSWLVRDQNYARVFNEKFPLEFFWRALQIMEEIDHYLVHERKLGRQERSNVRYHLARVAVAVAVTSSRPKPALVARMTPSSLGEHLDPAYDWVVAERDKVAAVLDVSDHGTLAKSADWANEIDNRLSRYSDKQNWPKKLDSGWGLP